MTRIAFRVGLNGVPLPADQATGEYLRKQKLGAVIHGDFKKARNPQFHRKFFALLNLAFDRWQPDLPEVWGIRAEKNAEQFREDLLILAGHYQIKVRLNGDARVVAKSISFANMGEDEFEKLYSTCIDVLLRKVFEKNATREQVEEWVDEILSFDG